MTATQRFLEPARSSAERMLQELLDFKIDPVDRGRFRVSTSRVKSPQRSFAKLSREKYRLGFTTYDAVPSLIDDLVGLRLICNNLSDINTFQEVIGELPLDDGSQAALSVERDSQRDYFNDPKPSGYRAFHVNFVVPVAQAQGTKRVRVEIQARTLLQDGWGELTHEDTYKPGSSVPDWIVRMSLRMADLLAAIDDIAQDLRTGLDVESRKAVEAESVLQEEESAEIVDASTATPEFDAVPNDSEMRVALIRQLQDLIEGLTRPTGLATIAQELTADFGTDITRIWSRSGGFKSFLESEIDGVLLTGPMPGYVHPDGASVDGWPAFGEVASGVPDLVRELRTHEKTLPLISPERMTQAIQSVAHVLGSADFSATESGRVSSAQLAALARLARTRGEEIGQLVVRPHAQYILLALNKAGAVRQSTEASQIVDVLLEYILDHLNKSGLSKGSVAARTAIRRWLEGES